MRRILAEPVAHTRALRFWRVWFEMASAVAVAVLVASLLENVWLAGLVATGIMAILGFVIVGVSPRQLGRLHSTTVVRFTAPMVRLLTSVLGPIPGWLVAVGSAAAPGAPGGDDAFFSEQEFRELLDRASESDMIEDTEAEMIQSVFDFGDTLVRAVMVPRTDIVSIDAGSSLHQAMSLFLRSGYSRIPVISENTDHILGIIYLKDVAAVIHELEAGQAPPVVEAMAREVRYVPESKHVSDLLRELQQRLNIGVILVTHNAGGPDRGNRGRDRGRVRHRKC